MLVSRKVRLLALGAALALPAGLATPALAAPGMPVGAEAYPTVISTAFGDEIQMLRYSESPVTAALATSRRQFNETAEAVYLLNPSEQIPAGIMAVATSDRPGPVLFTDKDGKLDDRTLTEVARLRPDVVIAVGNNVEPESVKAATDMAQEAHDNTDDGHVTVLLWKGKSASETSAMILEGAFDEGTDHLYVIDEDLEEDNVAALAAIAGSTGDGPVLELNADDADLAKRAIADFDAKYVVAIGSFDPSLLADITGSKRMSSIDGSTTSIALNVASLRQGSESKSVVVAPLDNPALLTLAAQSATGPLIPLVPSTSETETVFTVLSASRVSSASTKRFVAIGEAGPNHEIFKAQRSTD